MRFLPLLLLTTVLSQAVSLSAQATLLANGALAVDSVGTTVRLEISGACDYLATVPIHNALSSAGFALVLDGERRRDYSGLVTTVVADTTLQRRSIDVAFRQLHATPPTTYVLLARGTYGVNGAKRLTLTFVNGATGVAEMVVHQGGLGGSIGYDRMAQELFDLLLSDQGG